MPDGGECRIQLPGGIWVGVGGRVGGAVGERVDVRRVRSVRKSPRGLGPALSHRQPLQGEAQQGGLGRPIQSGRKNTGII